MTFIFYNENPDDLRVGDCVVRAIAKAENMSWYDTYIDICAQGMEMSDMPDSNRVWMAYLKDIGYKLTLLPPTCPNCYTIGDFCKDNPTGTYLVCTGSHIVCVDSGNLYDTWDSSSEIAIYYFVKEQDNANTISNVQ